MHLTIRLLRETFASIFPRQSPSSWILSSMNAEADSAGTGFFIWTSNYRCFAAPTRTRQ